MERVSRRRQEVGAEEVADVARQVQKASKKPVSKFLQKWSSTGITLLDLVMGGGVPWGRIINIVGDFSTGKTYLVIEILAFLFLKVLGKKLKWYYDDSEGGFSFDTRSMYGFDIIKEDQVPSFSVEQFGVKFKRQLDKLKDNEYLIYILDTLDGLPSEAERKRDDRRTKAIEKSMEDNEEYKEEGSYKVEKPKYLSEFFRLRAADAKVKKVLLVVISQVRDNIGVMFGEKHSRTGGKALDFYASHCLWLAEVEKMYKRGRVVGIGIKARLKKAKITKPFRETYLNIIFDYGVDNIRSNIDFLYNLRTETGKEKKDLQKTKLEWNGHKFTVDELIKHIERKGLEDKLAEKVIDKWNKIEESISSKERKSKWNK